MSTVAAAQGPVEAHIFLSPLKPPTKASVSAEAINASLFYLHVATPEDEALMEEVKHEREAQAQRRREALEAAGEEDPAQREFARMNNVRRKPVGAAESVDDNAAEPAQESAAQAPLPRRPVPMPHVSAENMSFEGTPAANLQPGMVQDTANTPVEPVIKSAIPRRPLPPLPPSEEPWDASTAAEGQPRPTTRSSTCFETEMVQKPDSWKENHDAVASGRFSLDSNRPHLPPRPSQDRRTSPTRSPGQSPTRQRRSRNAPRSSDTGFHITLIRRDPASGTQWNVATISTPSMEHNATDIEISTPGYNRFTGSNEAISLADLAANLPAGMIRTAAPSIPPSVAPEPPSEQPSGPRKFRRQVCVSKPYDDSVSDIGNGNSDNSKLKSGYYSFNSPWNGTCTFASSVNGRSLKCKHMIPGPGGQMPVQGEEDPNPAVTVAEIRFNTPFQAANLHFHAAHRSHLQQGPSSLTYDPTNPDAMANSKRNSLAQFLNPNTYSRPRAHTGPNAPSQPENARNFHPGEVLRRTSLRASRFARQNHFHSHPHASHPRRSTSTSSGGPDSDEDRLDLSLAREKAGGGIRGKSAKLGKLIIEDEGFKMLDLVVSACMAVWWRGYYC
ncbi:hypothetical protein N7512_000558 [Penicillium capsulatum]|nr:hypothetical protein N7512_000558 [Penicillium capsulatum]